MQSIAHPLSSSIMYKFNTNSPQCCLTFERHSTCLFKDQRLGLRDKKNTSDNILSKAIQYHLSLLSCGSSIGTAWRCILIHTVTLQYSQQRDWALHGTMTPDGRCRLHRSVIVSRGRWVAEKQAEDFGREDQGLPRLEEEWFGKFIQASSRLKIGFSLNWRWNYLARSSYSVFAA